MFKTFLACASAALVLGFAETADAAFVQQTGGVQASYANLTGTLGATAPSFGPFGVAGNTVSFSSPNGLEFDNSSTSLIDSNYSSNTALIAQCGNAGYFSCNPAGALTITFGKPVFSFTVSADDYDTFNQNTFTLLALDIAGATIGTLTASSLGDNGSLPAVLAATSTAGISRLVITDALTAGGASDGDFVVGAVGVPEPSSVALLGAGLLGVLRMVRRRA